VKFLALSIALATCVIMGCAAVPTMEDSKPIAVELARYKSAQVTVDGTEQIRNAAGFEATSTALRDEFVANLRTSGRFSNVAANVADKDALLVLLRITDLNYVHGATRGAVGIFAGRAVLGVTMMLSDKSSGAMLGALRASHSSSHAQGVFSPVTSTQVTAIAKEFSAKLTGK
jgi:Domain of unknown function (DUF4410)